MTAKFRVAEDHEWDERAPAVIGLINANILQLARKFGFGVVSNGDGGDQSLTQKFKLANGRGFRLEHVIHTQGDAANRIDVLMDMMDKPLRQDLLDIVDALDLPQAAIELETLHTLNYGPGPYAPKQP